MTKKVKIIITIAILIVVSIIVYLVVKKMKSKNSFTPVIDIDKAQVTPSTSIIPTVSTPPIVASSNVGRQAYTKYFEAKGYKFVNGIPQQVRSWGANTLIGTINDEKERPLYYRINTSSGNVYVPKTSVKI